MSLNHGETHHSEYFSSLHGSDLYHAEDHWNLKSWKRCTARQQPVWPDYSKVEEARRNLSAFPPLVHAGDVQNLKNQLALAAEGKAFILQGGDCSENFLPNSQQKIHNTCKTIACMASVIWIATGRPLIKIGRMAGQFAKPRSSDTETKNGTSYPSYRGDLVNDVSLNLAARIPDPRRILKGYAKAHETLAELKLLESSEALSITKLSRWNKDLKNQTTLYEKYRELIDTMGATLRSIESTINVTSPYFNELSRIYTSHEALLLPYEEGLIRKDLANDNWYGSSGHMLWIGERTRQLDSAHIEMVRGITNPIGVKIGPEYDPREILELCSILNPHNEAGRLTLITRFGRDRIEALLPPLIESIEKHQQNVVWVTDPMHGNTYSAGTGFKTRHFDHILAEVNSFFRIHKQAGTVAGGIHLEMTGEDVTECVGGCNNLTEEKLGKRYLTSCDPRLNELQSLELAFECAGMVNP